MSEVHRRIPYRRDQGARLRKLAAAYRVIAEVRAAARASSSKGYGCCMVSRIDSSERVQAKGYLGWG